MGLISSIYRSTDPAAENIQSSPKTNARLLKIHTNRALGGKKYHTAGAVVSLRFQGLKSATIHVRTSYPMPTKLSWAIAAELRLHARRRAVPDISQTSVACQGIRAQKAISATNRLLMMARRGYIDFQKSQRVETPAGRSEATSSRASLQAGSTPGRNQGNATLREIALGRQRQKLTDDAQRQPSTLPVSFEQGRQDQR